MRADTQFRSPLYLDVSAKATVLMKRLKTENIQEAIELYLEPVETDITANQDSLIQELVV